MSEIIEIYRSFRKKNWAPLCGGSSSSSTSMAVRVMNDRWLLDFDWLRVNRSTLKGKNQTIRTVCHFRSILEWSSSSSPSILVVLENRSRRIDLDRETGSQMRVSMEQIKTKTRNDLIFQPLIGCSRWLWRFSIGRRWTLNGSGVGVGVGIVSHFWLVRCWRREWERERERGSTNGSNKATMREIDRLWTQKKIYLIGSNARKLSPSKLGSDSINLRPSGIHQVPSTVFFSIFFCCFTKTILENTLRDFFRLG